MIRRRISTTCLVVLIAVAAWLGCKSDAADPGANFSVRPNDVTLQVGQTQQLSAVGAPGAVSWSSSNSAFASVVPQTGFVTAVAKGDAQISAVSGSSVATANVQVINRPAIQLSATQVAFAATRGEADPAAAVVDIGNAGDAELANLGVATVYAQGQPTGWLSAQLAGTTAPTQVTLRAAIGTLPAGSYAAVASVSAPGATNSPLDIAVTFEVAGGPAIQLTPTAVGFVATTPFATPAPQTVAVTNGGGGSLTNLATGTIAYGQGQSVGWLTAQLDRSTAPATVTLTATPAGLAPGTFNASVPIVSTAADNSPVNLPVTLTVGAAPTIAVNPTALTFSTFEGGNAPNAQAIAVTSSGGAVGNLSFSIAYSPGAAGWLGNTAWQNNNTTTPANLVVRAASFPRGTYTATITISAGAGITPRDVTVTYVVSSFSADVAPLFSNPAAALSGSPCSNCHFELGGTTADRHTYLTTNPAQGLLLCKITGGMGCQSGTNMRMTPAAIALIQAWIAAGSPSN